jgi:hypothetical protein
VHSAARFADSVGVNAHVASPRYDLSFEVFDELLGELGVKHIRDELRPSNRIDRWAHLFSAHGIRSTMLVSPHTNSVPEMMRYISLLGHEKLAAIEGQNEGNSDWFQSTKAAQNDWRKTVIEYQQAVFGALRSRYTAEELPVLSPTVLNWRAADMALLAPAAPYCDVLAIHAYVQDAQEPETMDSNASLDWYIRRLRDPFKPGAPIQATEMGYNNIVQPLGDGISEEVAAIYIPRMLLHNFAKGIDRTFLYEFFNGGPSSTDWESNWGLVRFDNTPKPAFYAVRDLLAAMSADASGSSSAPVTPLARDDVSSSSNDVLFVQFNRDDGRLVVALWRNLALWNQALAQARLPVKPVSVKIAIPHGMSARLRAVPSGDGWINIPTAESTIELMVDEKIQLVELGAA